MKKITKVHARQIIDSRGNPTIEAEVTVDHKVIGRAAVPSGASTGKYEAVELRDNDKNFLGRGVQKAIFNINTKLNKVLRGISVFDQELIDNTMIDLDGTANKSNFGANAILAVSLACCRAASNFSDQFLFEYLGNDDSVELPIPMMNILNGGSHADNSIDFQEFMIMPVGVASFSDSLRMGVEIFHFLKEKLKKLGYTTNVGDEGGFAPNLRSNEEAIEIVLEAIQSAGYQSGKDVYIALDAAASEFYISDKKVYHFHQSDGRKLSQDQMVDYWTKWTDSYPIISIEDGLDEDDWNSWKKLTDRIGGKVQLVGDDLFVTSEKRLKKGIENGVANSILVKVNQIGTLTETLRAVNLAHKNGYTTVMSHRSGETEDTTISDLSVALNCGQIKTGSLSRTDRTAKYNQLIRIEEKLGSRSFFRGKKFKYIT